MRTNIVLAIFVMLLLSLGSVAPAFAGEDGSSTLREIDRTALTTQVLLWPRANDVPFGLWSKLGGTVSNTPEGLLAGETVYLQWWDGSTWQWLATVQTNSNGYFQKWFYTESSPRTYRAKHAGDGTLSNTTTVTFTDNIGAWNHYRPKVRYCQWTKIHGKYGGSAGPYPNTTLYMQKQSGSSWVWQATVQTNGSGYYAAWAPVCPTTTFRMATGASVVTSAQVTKIGSTITGWVNSKVHGVLKDGYGSRVGSKTVYLQKWNAGGDFWAWSATRTTSSTGYVGFTPASDGTYRVATWGSAVASGSVAYSDGSVGRAAMERVCSQCHGLKDSSGAEITPEGRGAVEGKESFAGVWMGASERDWEATVDRMKGANECPMTDAEAASIVSYMDANVR